MHPLKKFIVKCLFKLGYEVKLYRIGPGSKIAAGTPFPHIDVLNLVIERELARAADWFFIQIGAHDGVSFDPIAKYIRQHRWRGILVEPQPAIFQRLARAHEGDAQLILENAAVGKTDATATLYKFKDGQNLPYHATMLASFYREALELNWHGYKGEIEEIKVPSLSVKTLLKKHAVSRVDLLQIDTEGFDKEIIQMFIDADCWPTIIHFEDTVGIDKNNAILQPLADKGYAFSYLYPDMLAYRQTDDTDYRRRTGATQEQLESLAPSF